MNLGPQKSLRFLVFARVASDPRVKICNFVFFFLFFFAMKRCPKLLCFKTTFSHRGMNVCPICDASLSHRTLNVGNLVPAYFPAGKIKKMAGKKIINKNVSPHRF